MYRLKYSRYGHAAGTIFYDPIVYDYGLARDETRLACGIEHLSVTLDPEGGYPLLVVPKNDLEVC